jgi:hypothetical protein
LLLRGVDEDIGPCATRAEGDNAVGDAFPCVETVFLAVELGLELFAELFGREGFASCRKLVVRFGRGILGRAIFGSQFGRSRRSLITLRGSLVIRIQPLHTSCVLDQEVCDVPGQRPHS